MGLGIKAVTFSPVNEGHVDLYEKQLANMKLKTPRAPLYGKYNVTSKYIIHTADG